VEEASWEAATLHQEEIDYVGSTLTDLLGRHYALQDQGATHVSHSQAAVLNPAHPSDGVPLPNQTPLGNSSSAEVLVEQIWATRILGGAAEAPSHPTIEHPHVEDTRTTRPKKGKPLPKGKLVQLLKDTKGWNIVLAGPDFVGISTVLRELEQLGYHVQL
jgi:hypothetical protein